MSKPRTARHPDAARITLVIRDLRPGELDADVRLNLLREAVRKWDFAVEAARRHAPRPTRKEKRHEQ